MKVSTSLHRISCQLNLIGTGLRKIFSHHLQWLYTFLLLHDFSHCQLIILLNAEKVKGCWKRIKWDF